MRHCFAILTLFVAVAATAGAADDEKYKSKEGKFAIQFPAKGKVKTDSKKVSGDIEMKIAAVEDDGKTYATSYLDLPDAAKELPAKMLLDIVEKGAVAQTGGKVESSKDIELGTDKLPARDIITDKDGDKTKMRMIINGTRLYIVTISGKKDFATDKDATKFLESFEITK